MGKKKRKATAPERTVTVGSHVLRLRCDLRAFRIFRDISGLSVLKGELTALDESTIPELLFSMAASADRTLWDLVAKAPLPNASLTLESLMDEMGVGDLEEVLATINELIDEALGAEDNGGGQGQEVKAAAG